MRPPSGLGGPRQTAAMAAAFLTGVDLEGRIEEDEDEEPPRLALRREPAPRRLPSPYLQLTDGAALGSSKLDYSQLLRDAMQIAPQAEEDPLEELRRLIDKTRKKMDNQTKVLNGFITDVNRMRELDRNFAEDEETPALANGAHPALGDRTASTKLKSIKGGLAGSSSVKSLSLVPSKSKGSLALARPMSAASEARAVVKRSESRPSLMQSASMPALMAPSMASFRGIEAPLVPPPRRAPPGPIARPRLPEALLAARRACESKSTLLPKRLPPLEKAW